MDIKDQKNISAIIIAKNEVDKIQRCISSAFQVADEVIVIDTGSSDGTQAKAIQSGARLFSIEWQGFGHAKNYGQQLAKFDWILSLDADEYLSEPLKNSILYTLLQQGCVYSFNRLTSLNGAWIKHGGWHPDWVTRLYEKKNATWSNDPIHEKLIWSSPPQSIKLKGLLYHESFKTRIDHQKKAVYYAMLNATKLFQKGRKASFYMFYGRPIVKFLKTVFLHRCFLDGPEGWYIAFSDFKLKRLEAKNLRQLWKNR